MTDYILSVEAMYNADKTTINSGMPGIELMQNAGRACFDAAEEKWPDFQCIVLCGPGNNGGDGFVIAELAKQAGKPVKLYATHPVEALKGDALSAANAWTDETHSLLTEDGRLGSSFIAEFEGIKEAIVLVDALFGAGLTHPLEGPYAELARLINSKSCKVLAVDVPSGISGDTGQVTGEAISADLTVTFAARKPAHCLYPAADVCGEVSVRDIGIQASVIQHLSNARLNSREIWNGEFPWPTNTAHKHQRGRLSVISGPAGSTGAARLAARAGLRIGAGVTTLWGQEGAIPEMAASSLAVMTKSYESSDQLLKSIANTNAIVFGPAAGLTPETKSLVLDLLKTGIPTVLDADAITVFKGSPSLLMEALHIGAVITPHFGEFEVLFPGLIAASDNKIIAVERAAAICGATVVLKGPDTVIGSKSEQSIVNNHASPFLATAGSGDVLAGMIAGLLSQGMSPHLAAAAGVWIHGDCALEFGPGLIAEDLIEQIPGALRTIYTENRPKSS